MNQSDSSPGAARSGLGILILLGAITAIGPMSIDMYLPALPSMARAFGVDTVAVQATVATFFAGMGVGQAFYGPAADRLGRRGPLLFGIAVFTIASVGCALAPSLDALVLLRLLQALGGCAGMVIARAVVRDYYGLQDSARIFSILMLIVGVAPILAPIAGSFILAAFDWRALFWLLGGFGALVGLGAHLTLKESLPAAVAARAKAEAPLKSYAAVLSNPRALRYASVAMLTTVCFFSFITAAPHLLIDVFGFTPQEFGLYFGINAAGIIGATQVNRLLLRHTRAETILRAALAGALAGALLLLLLATTGALGAWGLLAALFLTLCGTALASPNGLAMAMSVDAERAGSVSAVVGTMQFLGGACMSALLSLAPSGTATPLALALAGASGLATLLLALGPRAASRR